VEATNAGFDPPQPCENCGSLMATMNRTRCSRERCFASSSNFYCSYCFWQLFTDVVGTPCNAKVYEDCEDCGNGTIQVESANCPDHSNCSKGHYWCTTHTYNCGTSRTHSIPCSHSRTSPHDD